MVLKIIDLLVSHNPIIQRGRSATTLGILFSFSEVYLRMDILKHDNIKKEVLEPVDNYVKRRAAPLVIGLGVVTLIIVCLLLFIALRLIKIERAFDNFV